METSKSSTRQLTLDELISSQEDSPANPTAWQESERERRTNATCGPRCCALFENAPRATSWAKTFAALLVGMEGWSSRRCALTWRIVGTPYNRSYFQLAVSVLPTEEIESGLLLTPTTREEVMDTDKFKERMEKYDNGTTVPNLATQLVGKGSQLSPLFVEEMMGFPRNWTASPFQSGDANPSKPTATPLSRK